MKSSAEFSIVKISAETRIDAVDVLAIEEPLEIRIGFYDGDRRTHRAISITMRTPDDADSDFELAAGFLFTEGIVKNFAEIEKISHCGLPSPPRNLSNTVRVDLSPAAKIDFKRLERHFYTTSSCGVCGKTSIAALATGATRIENQTVFAAELIHDLPRRLREKQNVFDKTGGLHAAALFDKTGELELLREDVGRHNAVDKLIGAKFLGGADSLGDKLLLVSGRASFELIQKALMAKIPILAAVGAPSSLAVELAAKFNMTLIGFLRDNRFNIYCGAERIGF